MEAHVGPGFFSQGAGVLQGPAVRVRCWGGRCQVGRPGSEAQSVTGALDGILTGCHRAPAVPKPV